MSVSRRSLLSAGAAIAAATLTGCTNNEQTGAWSNGQPSPDATGPHHNAAAPAAPAAGSPSAAAHSAPAKPDTDTAKAAAANASVPYAAKLTTALQRYLKPTTENPKHPTYAGAVALVMVDGKVTASIAVGHALRYGAGPVELPAAKRVAMRTDSIFDLASLTKVYTSILLLQQVDKGLVGLDTPVVKYLPAFTGTGKDKITVRMLLTHTSGLPVGPKFTGLTTVTARRNAVLTTPMVSGGVPGKTYRYSSTGLLVAAQLIEKVTGKTLDAALKAGVTTPLGLRDTGYKPLTWLSSSAQSTRLVATDARSGRGLLRGTVHDDITNQLGGVAGSAGVFATAADVAAIGQLLLNGGTYNGTRILSAATVQNMLTNHNKGLPAIDPDRPGRPSDHGLGITLRQPWFMGRLSTPTTYGHTGFTGTSLLVEPRRKLVLALLTNRAHPNWSWANPDPMRAVIANVLADAIP